MPRTGKSKPLNHALQLAHALQLVRELQAKKNAADDKEWRSSISEGLVALFPVAVTHGLKLGRSWSRQTNIEESDPTHQIPSSTNSFHHPHEVEPTQTRPYKPRDKTGMHDGNPTWFHTRRVVSCRILQSPGKSPNTCPPRKHARYRTNTNGTLAKSNGSRGRTSTNPSQGAAGMHQEPCGSETSQDGFLCQ